VNSLSIVERFLGEKLTAESLETLLDLPIEQLANLLDHLYEGYHNQLDIQDTMTVRSAALIGNLIDPALDAEGYLNSVKRAAIFLDGVNVNDPLDGTIWPVCSQAVLTGGYSESLLFDTKRKLEKPFKSLTEISELVRQGGISISPRIFANDRPEIQDIAQNELGDELPLLHLPDGTVSDEPSEYATSSAYCSYYGYRPVATTPRMMHRLKGGVDLLVTELGARKATVEVALSKYSIPNLSNLPIEELVAFQSGSSTFLECRRILEKAVADSYGRSESVGLPGGVVFRQEFAESLEEAVARLSEEVKKTTAFNQWVPPTLTTVAVSAIQLNGLGDLSTAIASCAAPGAAWLVSRLAARSSRESQEAKALTGFFGYLLK